MDLQQCDKKGAILGKLLPAISKLNLVRDIGPTPTHTGQECGRMISSHVNSESLFESEQQGL